MGKAGGTGGPCGSLVLLGVVEASGSWCPLHQGSRHLAGSLSQAPIPLGLHHGAGAGGPSPGAEQLELIRHGKAVLCLMLWDLSMGLRWVRGSSSMASCFPPLLPLHRFPQEASEHIGAHLHLSYHAICSSFPAVCLCLLFKSGSWWWQGFGGVGFDGLLQWGVSQDHRESLCAGGGHCSGQLQQLLECRLPSSDAERELSLKGFQRRSVQLRNDAPVASVLAHGGTGGQPDAESLFPQPFLALHSFQPALCSFLSCKGHTALSAGARTQLYPEPPALGSIPYCHPQTPYLPHIQPGSP